MLPEVSHSIGTYIIPVGALAAGKGSALTMVGLALILGGAAFKLGAFPFHAWIPDVYQGAPTPVTAFLAVASKAAGFAVLLTLVLNVFDGLAHVKPHLFAASKDRVSTQLYHCHFH